MRCRLCFLKREFFSFVAMLYMFEDNEAVIKMVIKGRSQTMRHVSRTHRVVLRPKTNSHSPLTEGNFTRDEWKQSSPSVQHQHFQLSKMPRNDVEENATRNRRRENCGKVETDVELGSRSAASSPTAPSSRASSRPGLLRAPSQRGSNLIAQCAGGSNQNDAASSSQVWLTDGKVERTCEETPCCTCR